MCFFFLFLDPKIQKFRYVKYEVILKPSNTVFFVLLNAKFINLLVK